MTQQQSNDGKPSGLKRFGQAVAKKNGVFTWAAFAVIVIAVGTLFMKVTAGGSIPH